MHYYQHNIADFNNAARHLTRVERALYRDLIELYYDTEQPLFSGLESLARRVLARTDEEKASLKLVLEEFFTLESDGYHNRRCDVEIAKYRAQLESKAKAGRASAAARQQDSTPVEHVLNECATNHKPITNNQEPLKPKTPSDGAGLFQVFWRAYPKKVGKADALKAFIRLKPPPVDEMLKALAWQTKSDQWTKDGGQFIPNPATWLNQRRWEDEPQTVSRSPPRVGKWANREQYAAEARAAQEIPKNEPIDITAECTRVA